MIKKKKKNIYIYILKFNYYILKKKKSLLKFLVFWFCTPKKYHAIMIG